MRVTLVKCLVLSFLATATLVAPAHAGWEDELVLQIEEEHGCEVAFLSHIIERTVEGRNIVKVKIHCSDKRSFDAYRPDESDPFQFTEATSSDA